jgi:glycosyltransferase involved in cell wall biosynthesis
MSKIKRTPVIVDTPQWTGLMVFVLCRMAKRPYYIVLRGDVFKEVKNSFLKTMNRQILMQARGVIFISEYLHNEVRDVLPDLARHCVIPCPYLKVPQVQSEPAGKGPLLTVTGFHFPEKVEPLLRAMRGADRIMERLNGREWVICGGGPLLSRARQVVAGTRYPDRIRLVGFQPDIESYYQQASLFLYLTGLETFGLVINEAFLHGLPVISNTGTSMDELIDDGIDGYLVNMSLSNWENMLLQRIALLYQNRNLAIKMGARGREKVLQQYSTVRIGHLLSHFIT